MVDVYKRPGTDKWQIQYYDEHGKRIRTSSGTEDKDEAHRVRASLLAEVERRKANEGKPRYQEIAASFLLSVKKPGTLRCYKQAMRRWDPYVRGKYLDEITAEVIFRFVLDHRPRLSGQTIRIALAYMGGVFASVGRELPPGKYRRGLPASRVVRRFMTHEEERALLNTAPSDMKMAMLIAAVETGLREDEQLSLRWSHVSLERRTISLPETLTKTSKPRIIPLTDRAMGAFGMLKKGEPDELVFPRRGGKKYSDVDTFWPRWKEDAKVKDLRWHDLRHTFARRWLVEGGGDLGTLSRLMGHSSIAMTMRYVAWVDDDLASKMREVEKRRMALSESQVQQSD